MKKYIVLTKIGNFSASEVRQFDNLEDARAFRDLLNLSNDSPYTAYYIVEVIE